MQCLQGKWCTAKSLCVCEISTLRFRFPRLMGHDVMPCNGGDVKIVLDKKYCWLKINHDLFDLIDFN